MNIPEFKPQAPVLVYSSAQIKRIMVLANRVAKDPGCSVVTILGESGVMKTELARWIAHNDVRKGNIVEIHCGFPPETLLESELYGRKKGAYTDAKETKRGLVEGAHRGVCIFDDINYIPITHQYKLAHFIEHGIYRRVGCNIPKKIDAKKIATTNVNWETAVGDGLLAKDLYNRLNSFLIEIPPLRDRKEDIEVLAKYFLQQKAKDMGRANIRLSAKVMGLFMEYQWPWNVRELKQRVESSITQCAGNQILVEHLPDDFGKERQSETQLDPMSGGFQDILTFLEKIVAKGFSKASNLSTCSSDLDDEEKELISYMINLDNPIIYRRDYQSYVGLSKSSVNRLFSKLEQRGFLVLRGVGRGTFYTLSLQRILRQ
jgi:DNA-binding NtrC family response regulator